MPLLAKNAENVKELLRLDHMQGVRLELVAIDSVLLGESALRTLGITTILRIDGKREQPF